MTTIDIAQQVAWFLEAAFPLSLIVIGVLALTDPRK
jgi:hypothetical protein